MGAPFKPSFGLSGVFTPYAKRNGRLSPAALMNRKTDELIYFNASNRALSRLLYRDAVFLCRMPFCTDLSSAETVSR